MKRHQEFKRKRKEEFKKKYSIIQLLNEYGKQGVEDYSPLDVTEEDFDIVIDLAKQKLEYIREIIELNEDKKSFGIFIYYAFTNFLHYIPTFLMTYYCISCSCNYFSCFSI